VRYEVRAFLSLPEPFSLAGRLTRIALARASHWTEADACKWPSRRDKVSSRMTPMDAHTFPGSMGLYLAELVKRWDVTAHDLLEGTHIRLDSLSDLRSRLPNAQVVALLERARQLTGEPALGFFLGTELRVSALGSLGMAVLSASTTREAIDLSIEFMPIVTTSLGLRLRIEGREASIVVLEHADFGTARDIVLLAVLTALWRIGTRMTGHSMNGYADLAMPEPEYFARLGRIGDHIRFNQPVTRLVFDASHLALPYKMHDAIALQFARQECAETLDSLEGTQRTVARVRGLLNTKRGYLPSVVQAASTMHMSARTLKRLLASEGTSFSLLVQEERRERAMLLLRSRTLSIKDVARSVGYSNVMNFTRAFQRWTGTTPGEHRRSFADCVSAARVA
jgi:AraC-like DNA-binding protein